MLFKDGQKMDTVCAITPEFQSPGPVPRALHRTVTRLAELP